MDSQRDLSMVTQTAVDPSRIPFALESPEQPLAPPRIPDYRLIKHIGSGAFGDVWLAEEKHVAGVFRAVKVLRSALGERLTTGSAATVRELHGLQLYETRARGHAHLVQVLHVGCVEHSGESGRDGIYYAMEIADHAGGAQPCTPEDYRPLTLRSLLRYGGRLSPERAIEYQMQLLHGLEHLHRNGLQHRDVKPGNLLFVRGKLKLGDLGLTSRDDARQSCGTVGYVPPGSKEPDDLYAAGIVLYEMLTGLPASQFPDWPEDLDPSQDARLAGLRAIFSRACDRDPQRRFADAPSFRTALEKANTASASINQVRGGDRRARRLAFLACGLCVAIAIAAAWFGYELYGAKKGFSYGKPPFDGSVAKLYSDDRKYLFEWSTSEKRLAVPTNSDERHVELFDLEARLDGSQLLIRGQIRSWSLGNPLPRRIEEANPGKHGEFVQVFLVLKTDNVEQLAKEVEALASKPERQRGGAAREKQFDTQFPKEIQLLLSAQLATSPGNINGFMPGIDLAVLGLTPNKSYPILAFVTAAESDEMYQALAICITADAGLRLGSVQYTPNPD